MPKIPAWVFVIIALVYFIAAGVDTMDVDASQYAEISREMLQRGDYLHVYDRGQEYLDKPPFLFWASALSMKVLGVNNVGYKLPSILFALLALYATYRLARLYYSEETARLAALVLATCQGMFLMTNDVRCDTILVGWVITAMWLIAEWQHRNRTYLLLIAAACIGFGMTTKGPIALMVPVFGFATHWALHRQWRQFAKPAYLLALAIIALVLLPMSIGLYQQFDLHPGKVVNGQTGVSGLRFFYWTQSFGRITGESPWKNNVYLLFLMENMLWSFLPWIVLFIPALIVNMVQLVRQRLRPQQEWISTGGFVLSYLSLASSAYQLPHYIFVAFPLAAIATAGFIATVLQDGRYRVLVAIVRPLFYFISVVLLLAVLALITYFFPSGIGAIVLWCLAAAGCLLVARSVKGNGRFIAVIAACIVAANVFVSGYLYPALLQYQLGSHIGRYISRHHIQPAMVACYKLDDPLVSIHFYAGGRVPVYDTDSHLAGKQYLLLEKPGMQQLQTQGYRLAVLDSGQYFRVSQLTLPFIVPATRGKETRDYFFVKVL